jgi:hypothetical protein
MHFVAPNGLVYEHPSSAMLPQQGDEAYFAGGTPSLSGYINSPELAQHSNGLDNGRDWLSQSAGGGGGGLQDQFDPTQYLDSGEFHHAAAGTGGGGTEPDLNAYVQQLEGFERNQLQQGGRESYEIGLGFESGGQHDLSAYSGQGDYY